MIEAPLPVALREALQEAVLAGVGSAAAAAVVSLGHGGQLRTAGGWCGHAAADGATAIDAATPFDLASLTKPIATTTLLAQAVAAHRLDLGDTLGHWLADAPPPQNTVTLRQLLGHASGWPAWRDFFQLTSGLDGPARSAKVRELVLATPLDGPPGQRAVYSDLGFMALGWAVEQACAAPLDVQFARQVAEPLGLGCRFFRAPAVCQSAVATEVWPPRCADGLPLAGAVHDDNCAALQGVAGHAGLFGSLSDVATWAGQWLLAACGRDNALGVPPELARSWVGQNAAPATTWRLGFDTPSGTGSLAGDNAPADAFGHLGFTGTSVWLAPSLRRAVVLLTNRVHPRRENVDGIRSLRRRLHALAWDLPDW